MANRRKRPLVFGYAALELVLARSAVRTGKAPRSHLRRAVAAYLERGAWDKVIDRQIEILTANTDRSSDKN